MSTIEVKPINNISGNVITYKNFHYKLDEIPPEFHLIVDAIDSDIENVFIDLINGINSSENKNKMKEILKCFAEQFQTNFSCKLNTRSYSKLPAGEGMQFFSEDPKLYNPCVVVISFGSDIMFTLQNTKTKKMYNIPLPRRSMFLLQDKEWKYTRGISKRPFDQIGSRRYIREDRYSLVFQSKKE
jgi:hypothetical protein